jgi:hypothetical protein
VLVAVARTITPVVLADSENGRHRAASAAYKQTMKGRMTEIPRWS